MLFRMLYDDKLAQASYVIGCQRTGEAITIDPQRDVERYIELADREGMKITAITETHIHADFLSGSRELAERTGGRLYLSDEGDADWKYRWLNKKQSGGSYHHQLVKHGDKFQVGNIQFEVMHTPGHTPEHICFLVTDLGGGTNEPMGMASGDFVFVGDVGRPDLLESAAGRGIAVAEVARVDVDLLLGVRVVGDVDVRVRFDLGEAPVGQVVLDRVHNPLVHERVFHEFFGLDPLERLHLLAVVIVVIDVDLCGIRRSGGEQRHHDCLGDMSLHCGLLQNDECCWW